MAARSALTSITRLCAVSGSLLGVLCVGSSLVRAQTPTLQPAARKAGASSRAGHARSPAKTGHRAPHKVALKTPTKSTVAAGGPAVTPLVLNVGTLPGVLRALGYSPETRASFQRLSVDEGAYVYTIDLGFSKSGDWLRGSAELVPIPDLTRVPAAPLLSLLAENDALLGMYFSYDRASAQILLNASVPVRGLLPASVKSMVEGMKQTVRSTQDLWNAAKW